MLSFWSIGTFGLNEISLANGAYAAMAWASSVAKLASRPIRVLILDEVDKSGYYVSSREASPISLGIERTETYWNKKIGRLLETEDLVRWSYVLEVGSPGIEPVLTRPEHYARFVGSRLEVRLHDPRVGRRTFRGELLEAGGEAVLVEDAEAGRVSLPYAAIRRAHLIVDPWEGLRSQERGPKGRRR